MTLEQAVFMVREHKLNLPERWFTGKQWADGSAQKEIREDYRRALLEYCPTLEIAEDGEQLEF
jgi:hypothetical protein